MPWFFLKSFENFKLGGGVTNFYIDLMFFRECSFL